jgi:CoA:oxalate CoA-transferase
MVSIQGWHIAHFLMTGKMAMASSKRTERSPLFTYYQARDGWFTIAIIDPRQWPALCRIVGQPRLENDPRFAETKSRNERAAELISILDECFAAKTREHWLGLLRAEGIPCGPVDSYAELAADEQVAANGYLVTIDQPGLGAIRLPGPPVAFSDSPGEVNAAPELGAHTESILRELGYSWEAIQELREKRTIL